MTVASTPRPALLGLEFQYRTFWTEACRLFYERQVVGRVSIERPELRAFDDVVTGYSQPVYDAHNRLIDGDQIIAVCALALGVDLVAVTSMTNLGFHALMAEHGIRVVTTDVGDRHVLEALRREGGILGGEQSGHIIALDGHVTGDGLAAALLLCRCLAGRSLAEAVSVMPRFAQVLESVPTPHREVSAEVVEEVERLNATLAGSGRVLVRPSGTEPVVRVLAEAPSAEEAAALCGRIAHLVRGERSG